MLFSALLWIRDLWNKLFWREKSGVPMVEPSNESEKSPLEPPYAAIPAAPPVMRRTTQSDEFEDEEAVTAEAASPRARGPRLRAHKTQPPPEYPPRGSIADPGSYD